VRLQNRRPSDRRLLCIVVRTGWYVAPAPGTLKAAVFDVCPAALRLVDFVRREDEDVAGKVAIIRRCDHVRRALPLREPVERRLRLLQGALVYHMDKLVNTELTLPRLPVWPMQLVQTPGVDAQDTSV